MGVGRTTNWMEDATVQMGLPIPICIQFGTTQVQSSSRRKKVQARTRAQLQRTLPLVVKMTNLRLLLGVVAMEDLELEHLNVNMAFLHKGLDETVYMSQPTSFTATGEQGHLVSKLKKSLYDLKQALRMWYHKFDTYIWQIGYNRSGSDPCMYIPKLADDSFIYMILYVDDMWYQKFDTYIWQLG